MLSRMVKQLVAAGLALAFMFTSALCLAAPNDKSDDMLPSVPDAESGTEYAAGVGAVSYTHLDVYKRQGYGYAQAADRFLKLGSAPPCAAKDIPRATIGTGDISIHFICASILRRRVYPLSLCPAL